MVLNEAAQEAPAATVSPRQVWWYTVKSVGLAAVIAAFAYHLGTHKR